MSYENYEMLLDLFNIKIFPHEEGSNDRVSHDFEEYVIGHNLDAIIPSQLFIDSSWQPTLNLRVNRNVGV